MIDTISSLASNFTPTAIAATPPAQCAGVGALVGTSVGAITAVASSCFYNGIINTCKAAFNILWAIPLAICTIPVAIIRNVTNPFSENRSHPCTSLGILGTVIFAAPAALGALGGKITKITVDMFV